MNSPAASVTSVNYVSEFVRAKERPTAAELADAISKTTMSTNFVRGLGDLDYLAGKVYQAVLLIDRDRPQGLLEGAGRLFSQLLTEIQTIAKSDNTEFSAARNFAQSAALALLGLARSGEAGFQAGRDIKSQYSEKLNDTWQMLLDLAHKFTEHRTIIQDLIRCIQTLRNIERYVLPEIEKGDGPNIRMHLAHIG